MRDSRDTYRLTVPLPITVGKWQLEREQEKVSGEWRLFARDTGSATYSAYLVCTAPSERALKDRMANGITVEARALHGIFRALVLEKKAVCHRP